MPRDPNSFRYVHRRPPPVMIAARTESTCKASVRRECVRCVTDCLDGRFASSLRFASRMHRGCIQAGADRLTRATSAALASSHSPTRSIATKARGPTGRRAASLAMPHVDAYWLAFSASRSRRHAGTRIGSLATLRVAVRQPSFPASGSQQAAGSAESLSASGMAVLPAAAVAIERCLTGVHFDAVIGRRRSTGIRSVATANCLGPSCPGAGPRQAHCGRAVP